MAHMGKTRPDVDSSAFSISYLVTQRVNQSISHPGSPGVTLGSHRVTWGHLGSPEGHLRSPRGQVLVTLGHPGSPVVTQM